MDIIKSAKVALHGVAVSMQGGRSENQDDYGCIDTPIGFLFIVCDGMGGGPGGKTASYIAKYEIAQALCQCNEQTPKEHALKMAVARAHQALEDKMKAVPSLMGMGSTFVAILIDKHSAFIAHAGDSRCYQLRGNKVVYRSKDHSLVAELVRGKALTEEEARLSPQSNVISRGLGSTSNHVPEIDEVPYRKGDRFVLCTDGVWGCMPQPDLLVRLTAKTDLKRLVSSLSSEIDNIGFSKGGTHDNHTMAVIDVDEDSEIRPSLNWKKIAMICSGACLLLVLAICLFALLSKKKDGMRTESISNPSVQNMDASQSRMQPASNISGKKAETKDSTTKVQAIDTDSLLSKLQRQKQEKDANEEGEAQKTSDSKAQNSQQEIVLPEKPKEITLLVIKKYGQALHTQGANAKEVIKSLEQLRVEIKKMMDALQTKTARMKCAQRVVTIKKEAENADTWRVDSVADKKTKKYGPTQKAQTKMKEQMEQLKKLKDNL